VVENNHLNSIWEQLIESSGYLQRRIAIDHFNKQSKTIKRGIALIPVKFGVSFNTPFLNQAGALVNIYTDGSVLVNHGGIEMGQGLYTKVKQVVVEMLGIDEQNIRVNATNTSKVPNTSATAASTGSDINGMAVKNAIEQIITRMVDYLGKLWNTSSLPDLVFKDNQVINQQNPNQVVSFADLVNQLYLNRISLSAQGYYATPDVYFDKDVQKGKPFHYFVFGMSVSEVEVNLLTGHHTIVRTDILHDCGNSINPEIDKGQIEGAFIQGVGWCTMEECKWNEKGKLLNSSPDTYKIPGINDIPKQWYINLLQDVPNPNTILNSKAVGEPPFIHGLSVFFAIRNALTSVARGKTVNLDIPATHEKVVMEIKRLKS
jgi:xanthine dehydrogenase large subunit